jgi:hypothetical protein
MYNRGPKQIYFIKPVGMPGPVKIGCSDVPTKRLKELSTWSPFPLEIVAVTEGTFELESNVHACFADTHSHREWFHASDRLTAVMARIAKGAKIADVIDLSDKRGNIRSNHTTGVKGRWLTTTEGKLFMSVKIRLNHSLRRHGLVWADVPWAYKSGVFDIRRGDTPPELLAEINAYIAAPYAEARKAA